VLWSLDGQAHTIVLPGQPLAVNRIGVDGKPVRENNNLTVIIDSSTLFIELN
jgi:hypothetical protein